MSSGNVQDIVCLTLSMVPIALKLVYVNQTGTVQRWGCIFRWNFHVTLYLNQLVCMSCKEYVLNLVLSGCLLGKYFPPSPHKHTHNSQRYITVLSKHAFSSPLSAMICVGHLSHNHSFHAYNFSEDVSRPQCQAWSTVIALIPPMQCDLSSLRGKKPAILHRTQQIRGSPADLHPACVA